MMLKRIALGICVLMMCAACKKPPRQFPDDDKDYTRPVPPGQVALRKITDPARIPDFSGAAGDRALLIKSLDYSLVYFTKPSVKLYYEQNPYLDITHARAVASLKEFRRLLNEAKSGSALHEAIVAGFDVYESIGCDDLGTVLFTGYFTPIYDASLTETPEFKYPLYKAPPDIVKDPATGECIGRRMPDGTVAPGYSTRDEIEGQGALKGKGLELVWLRTRFQAYSVTIQGSARLRMPDGTTLNIGYAASNGLEYQSPATAMIADGAMTREQQSYQWMRNYFETQPEMAAKYLNANPRYIFFKKQEGGPYGSLGQPVTSFASIATDKQVFPRGCIAFARVSRLPHMVAGAMAEGPYDGFMLDQDTGGAIRSAGRCDIYMGMGEQGEALAGRVKNEGRLYYIFVKDMPVSIAPQR